VALIFLLLHMPARRLRHLYLNILLTFTHPQSLGALAEGSMRCCSAWCRAPAQLDASAPFGQLMESHIITMDDCLWHRPAA
jgi:hypothetical protein